MARCARTRSLEVHHRRRDGGNDIGNAAVLCETCHEATSTYGVPGISPPAFSQAIKLQALINSGNRCECISTSGCH